MDLIEAIQIFTGPHKEMRTILEDRTLRNKVAVFKDRVRAGRALASFLKCNGISPGAVLAIPNGGVPVGCEVSKTFRCRLYVSVVRKVLFPWTTEAGFGAVSWTGLKIVDWGMARYAGLTKDIVKKAVLRTKEEVEKRCKIFYRYLPERLSGEVVIVDDGIATGYTMLASIRTAKQLGAEKIIAAAPTAPTSALNIVGESDITAVLNLRDAAFFAVADAYEEWRDLDTLEALEILERCSDL